MNNVVLVRMLVGFTGAAVVAFAAKRLKLLTADGALAAAISGGIVFGFGGWRMAALFLMFFLSSSLLTRMQAERKFHPEHTRGRSAGQVLANGAVASVFAILYGLGYSWAASGFAAAVAASTADTWATEVGLLNAAPPRLITTWRKVPAGTSGGITWLGTVAGIVGAAVTAFLAFYWMSTSVVAVLAAGVIAMLVDSVLGATIEGRVKWIDNNAVNLIATAVGSAVGLMAAFS